jgi:hypothetical protein
MSIAVQDFVDKILLDLVDEDRVTWTDDDIAADLSEGIRALCAVKPDAYVLTEAMSLVAGTIQSLPAGSTQLFDLAENVASGRRITQVDQELLDETYAFWPAGTQAADVKHFTIDPRDPTQYRVYPPNDGTGEVIGSRGAVPEAVTVGSDILPVNDKYEPALVQYTLGAAYRRNTQRQDLTKSAGYLQAFYTMLGLGAKGQSAASPRVATSPGAA